MLKNYFITAYRNLLRNKTYAFINIFGLGFSVGAVILVLLYIRFEFSYDNFHKDGDRIYRISVESFREGNLEYESYTFTPPIGIDLKQEFPEVENYTRHSVNKVFYFNNNDRPIRIGGVIYADSTFLDFFTFDLISGNKTKSLINPNEIVLTEYAAKKLFGKIDVLGKTLHAENGKEYLITGVVKNPPANSTIQFNALISFSTLYANPRYSMGWNGGNQYITYVKLKKNVNPIVLQSKFSGFMWEHINKDLSQYNVKYEAYLQPLKDIHLVYGKSGLTNIYFFSIIGALILLIASFNFINLTTSQYTKRAKEIAVRKVIGADRKSIAFQFLFETMLIAFAALLVGIFLAKLFTPIYRNLMQTNFYEIDLLDPAQLAGLIALLLSVGLIAGSYPSFYLSSVKVTDAFKNNQLLGHKRFSFQSVLILFQFVVSVSLIIITLFVNEQLSFIKNKELGFDKENIILLSLQNENARKHTEIIKERLKTIPGVISVSASSAAPSNGFTSNGYFPEGFSTPVTINALDVDEDFFKTYKIKLIEGKNFSKELSTDDDAYIVNEALVKQFGWKNPIGKTITRDGKHLIIGVVKDFNFASLHKNISPLIITNKPWGGEYNLISLKVKTSDYNALLGKIENAWKEINPQQPFEYGFLDWKFEQVYTAENNLMKLFLYFSILAIVIAALGLFSLSSLSVEQRTKEIGIRKVLGASLTNLAVLSSKKYIVLVVIANVIAFPISYYLVNKWLQNYAYKIDINLWVFIFSGGIALTIALVTVSFQAVKKALANPIDSLRSE
ncbi:MAG: FtsX-like permease family protein [Chlorobi bacterium]|nr:FtsX-like permease family protein [Chlorobiota bacterium]